MSGIDRESTENHRGTRDFSQAAVVKLCIQKVAVHLVESLHMLSSVGRVICRSVKGAFVYSVSV